MRGIPLNSSVPVLPSDFRVTKTIPPPKPVTSNCVVNSSVLQVSSFFGAGLIG